MRWKKHKTDRTKYAKGLIIGRRTVQELIGGPIESSGRRDLINGVNSNKSSFSPKEFRDRSKKEQSPNSVQDVLVFTFSMTILLRSIWA
jgi:hypothetical protein